MFSGEVRRGDGVMRKYGFPTANLYDRSDEFEKGAYIADTNVEGRPALVVKLCPDLVEVHVIGFDGDLYGKQLELDNLQRIPRGMCASIAVCAGHEWLVNAAKHGAPPPADDAEEM